MSGVLWLAFNTAVPAAVAVVICFGIMFSNLAHVFPILKHNQRLIDWNDWRLIEVRALLEPVAAAPRLVPS